MFKNKHIVITGGSSGLGLELAYRLAEEEARLTLIARNLHKLRKAEAAIKQRVPDVDIQVRSVDVCNEDNINAAMNEVAESNQGIDILINSAGVLREGYFEKIPMSDFREVMEINFFGILHATRAALPYLEKSKGRLVNVASVAGLTGVFGYTPYCSSKHALIGLSESLRYELKSKGISVHVVCPGEFDSPMVDELDTYRTNENRAHTLTIPKNSVEAIAVDTLAGIRANKFMIVPGFMARMTAFMIRHFVGIVRRMGDQIVAKAQKNQ